MTVFLIILSFIIYSLLGTMICDKLGILHDNNDFLDLLIDSIFIAFWPLILIFHFFIV